MGPGKREREEKREGEIGPKERKRSWREKGGKRRLTSSSNEDLDLVVDQRLLDLSKSLDDTLEGGSDVGEVGDTSTDDEDLSVGVNVSSSDERD